MKALLKRAENNLKLFSRLPDPEPWIVHQASRQPNAYRLATLILTLMLHRNQIVPPENPNPGNKVWENAYKLVLCALEPEPEGYTLGQSGTLQAGLKRGKMRVQVRDQLVSGAYDNLQPSDRARKEAAAKRTDDGRGYRGPRLVGVRRRTADVFTTQFGPSVSNFGGL